MKTWVFKFEGNLPSSARQSGTSLRGTVEVRATSVDDALKKFNLIFSAPMVRITSIAEEQ